MYKLEFTLKQHTPIIHFQHDQEGATLRASEVKPKLDRFIIEKLTGQIGEKAFDLFKTNPIWKNWLVGKGDHAALDYKLILMPQGVNIQSSIIYKNRKNNKYESHYPLLLANMGGSYKKEDLRDLIQFEEIKGRIVTFNSELIPIITNSISSFYAIENFGNRSSKGFGSFTISDYQIGKEEKVIVPWDDNIVYPSSIYYLKIETKDVKDVFEVIDYYWKRLKSGINYSKYNRETGKCTASINPNLYKKSFLYKYLENTGGYNFIWEKRKVKRDFFNRAIPSSIKDERFARALLGLPDKFSYARTFEDCNPVKPRTKIDTRIEINIDHEEKVESRKIDRIPSPIVFKPVKFGDHFRVYILINDLYTSYSLVDIEFTLSIADFTLTYGKGTDGKELKIKLKAGTKFSDVKTYLDRAVDYATINGFRNPEPDLRYFLSLPPSTKIKTPPKGIDLNELIDEYNKNELKLSFTAIDYNGENICLNDVTIDKI